jgi:hypothetical protein
MFTRNGSNIVTKMATAAVSAVRNIQQAARGKKNGCSENSANDMANIAAARRIVEEQQQQQSSSYKKMKCEITKNYKNEADCTCKRMCMAKVSETMYIHQEHQEQEEQHKKNR